MGTAEQNTELHLDRLRNEPWSEADLALFGLRSATEGGMLFCAVTEEAFAINGVTHKWPPGITLKWHIAFSRLGSLSDMDLKQTREANLAEIAAACDVKFEYTSNPRTANLYDVALRLDGPNGVLADRQIPVGNVSDLTQLLGRHDDAERWGLYDDVPPVGFLDWGRVDLHELLHAMGLGHGQVMPADSALIEPMYNPKIRHLQRRDKSELVRRYGESKAAAPPASGGKPVNYKGIHEIEQNGMVWRGEVSGVLARVK